MTSLRPALALGLAALLAASACKNEPPAQAQAQAGTCNLPQIIKSDTFLARIARKPVKDVRDLFVLLPCEYFEADHNDHGSMGWHRAEFPSEGAFRMSKVLRTTVLNQYLEAGNLPGADETENDSILLESAALFTHAETGARVLAVVRKGATEFPDFLEFDDNTLTWRPSPLAQSLSARQVLLPISPSGVGESAVAITLPRGGTAIEGSAIPGGRFFIRWDEGRFRLVLDTASYVSYLQDVKEEAQEGPDADPATAEAADSLLIHMFRRPGLADKPEADAPDAGE